MNIRQVNSLDLSEENTFLQRFSRIPSSLLDWIEENQQEGFIIWDENERICYATKSINQLLGYQTDEIIGKRFNDIWDIQNMKKLNTHLSENQSELNVFKISYINKDNIEICIEFKTEKIKDNVSGDFFHIGIMKDITEIELLKKMRMEAERTSALGQIAAGVAHEIRNPLTSLKGFLQLLQGGIDYKDEYYKIMTDEIEKMETITSELLFISKPVTNQMILVSVDKMIREISFLLQSQAKMKNIEIVTEENISDAKILCDSSQIKQVLINLIKNAVEAMDDPGEIKVYSKETESEIKIYVEDEGAGLPDALAEQVILPFFTTKKNGTGLGLSISKEIMELHGGTLLYSKNKIKGSTFIIIFPKKYVQ